MKIEFEPIPNYGDLFTIKKFRECVECGGFIDYDGHGRLSDGKRMTSNILVYPSDFKKGKVRVGSLWKTEKIINIPNWATHIVWFNR